MFISNTIRRGLLRHQLQHSFERAAFACAIFLEIDVPRICLNMPLELRHGSVDLLSQNIFSEQVGLG